MVMLSTVSCLKAKVDEPVIVLPDTTGVGKIQYREKAKQVYLDILLKNFRILVINWGNDTNFWPRTRVWPW